MSDPELRFDAFISYSHTDRPWVDGRLVPSLEHAGLRVAIDHRDFGIGVWSQKNMEDCVDASRHVVIVLSPAWRNSEWSRFEFLMASADDPAGNRQKIIPVLIADTDLPKAFRVRTYADFRDEALFESEMGRVIRAIMGGSAPPSAVPDAPPPLANWQNVLADLIVRSGKAHPQSRTALCLEIGIDPNELAFLGSPPRAFATEIVAFLLQTGNRGALLAICAALRPLLQGSHAESLKGVDHTIRITT